MFRIWTIAMFIPFAASAAGIRTLFEDTPPLVQTLTLTGQVVVISNPLRFSICDETGAIDLQTKAPVAYRPGDVVIATGHINHFHVGLPWFEADGLTLVGNRSLPEAQPASAAEIVSGERNGRMVRYEGVVTDTLVDDVDHDWCWLLVESHGEKVPVALPKPKGGVGALTRLLDAEVSVVGMPMPDSGYRRFLKSRICLASPESIVVTKPPPADPFDVEEFKNTAADRLHLIRRFEHRRKIAGRIVASWRRRYLFITSGHEQNTLVDLGSPRDIPPSGTSVVASGFLQRNAFHVRLDNALVKTDQAPVAPVSIDPPMTVSVKLLIPHAADGIACAKPDINPILHGKLVRLTGCVRSHSDLGTGADVCYLDCDGTTIPVELGDLTPPAIGSRVEVTGACIMSVETNPGSRDFVRPAGASLAPRSQTDIRILAGPNWLTPVKSMVIVSLSLVLIITLMVCNRQRQRRVRREALLRLDERTRLAVELHDSLAQTLTGVSLQLDAAEMAEAQSREAARQYLENARNALRSCREGLRYCLGDLRSRSFEDADMTEAVQETVRPQIGKAVLFVRFNVPRARLSDSSAHAVLCIIRELAVNAVRHGKADRLYVAGEFVDGTIRFSVRDNGCGFDPAARPGPAEGHFGLLGVRERLRTFGGTLKIESSKTSGTKVTATLNIHEKDNHSYRR